VGGYVTPDMWSPSEVVPGIEDFSEGAQPELSDSASIEDFGEGVDAKKGEESQESSGPARKSASKSQLVVLRLTIKVPKHEAVTTIQELQEYVKGDAGFEVPQSSLPIKGLVKWNHRIAGSQVQKWVAITTEM
jgi:hypothetical protein